MKQPIVLNPRAKLLRVILPWLGNLPVEFRAGIGSMLGQTGSLSDNQARCLSYATAALRCRSRYTLQIPLIRASA
jgi:hypothetical protein